MTIKLLTFDLDDTLWPCMVTILRTEQQLHHWFSCYHPQISYHYSIQQLRQKRLQLVKNTPNIAHNLTALRKQSFIQLSQEMSYSIEQQKDFVEQAFNFYINQRNQVNFYDDVIPTLENLYFDYPLAAVTNGNADIYQMNLGHFFQFSWSAADAGQQKPHPIVFQTLLENHNLQTSEIIHIGDDPISDIQGAQQLGIRAIWLNREQITWPEITHSDLIAPITPPFMTIQSLNQLPEIIRNLQ
jgi:putative hydrolase of the HAD superfamily